MGQVVYPDGWTKKTPLEQKLTVRHRAWPGEVELFDDVPFPGVGLHTEELVCLHSHRAGHTGGWRISPASVARAFWGGLCLIASLPFVMLFVGAAIFFGALKYIP